MYHLLLLAFICFTALFSFTAAAPLQSPSQALSRRQESWDTWCGAVRYDPTGAQVKSVEGTWTIPGVSVPNGGTNDRDYWLYHWVGIDGSYGCNTILQSGSSIDTYQGRVRRRLWWQFYPDDMVYIDEVPIDEDDDVYVKVTGVTKTSGVIYVKNKTTGVEKTIIAHLNGNGGLCFNSAAWVVEAPHTSTYIWPLAGFTRGTISGAKATQFDNSHFGLDGAAIGDMVQKGKALCYAKDVSDTAVSMGSDQS